MGVHFDTRQVDELGLDLTEAPKRVQLAARHTMRASAGRIERGMRDDFSGHKFARGTEDSLETQQRDQLGLAYEIGELDAAGYRWGLAAILAFGTSNNTPRVDHTASLRRETPRLVELLAGDAEDAVLGGDA